MDLDFYDPSSLGIWCGLTSLALQALSQATYLCQASLKHITYQTVFLLAMATSGRCDSKYCQMKLGWAGVTFQSSFTTQNQKPTQTNDPGSFQRTYLGGNNLVF